MADLQVAESIFSAIDTIVNKRLENLPYDKTILATIEDNSNASIGEYTINDGSSSMRAYSDYTDYNVGDNVYVNIPLGDMTQQKHIIGKYNVDDTNGTPLGYHDPMDDLVDITGNIFDSEQNIFELIANDNKTETDTIWAWSAEEAETNPIAAFKVLALQAGFKSSVGRNSIVSSGNYGLRLDFKAIKKATQLDVENVVYYSFYLDSSGFFGDPYNFETYYKQSKLLNLEEQDISRIDAMRLVFYQEKNFRDPYDELVPIADYPNLSVSDIEIKFGYDISEFADKDNAILLYTFDTKTYVNSITPNLIQKYKDRDIQTLSPEDRQKFFDEVNQKTILCRWITRDEDDNLIAYGTDNNNYLPDGASIRWYRYHYTEQTDKTKYSDPPGDFWEEIDPENTRDQFIIEFTPNSASTASEKIKVVIWSPTQEYVEQELNEDPSYESATFQYNASKAIKFNFDPLEFLRLCFSDPKYSAYLRYHSIVLDECNGNQNFIDIANLPNTLTEGGWYSKYEFINKSFNDLFASDNTEDVFIICSSIKRQVEILKEYLNLFSYIYFKIDQSPTFSSVQARIEKELEILQDFYEETFDQLGDLSIKENPDDNGLEYVSVQNGDFYQWRNILFSRAQEYANQNWHNSIWQVNPYRQNFTSSPQYLNNNHYGLIIQYLNAILTECNKLADDTTKDYQKIKTLFLNLPVRIDEQADLYYETWYTNNPILSTWNGTTFNELKYKQILFYSNFSEINQNDQTNCSNIEMSIKGQANYILSDELEFLSEDPTAWLDFSSVKDLTLEVDVANSRGSYQIYNDDGSIINDGEAQVVRLITAKYTNPMTGIEDLDSAAEKIIWKIPKYATMISPPEEGYEYRFYDYASPTAVSFYQGQYYVYNNVYTVPEGETYQKYILADEYQINTQYYVKNNVEFYSNDEEPTEENPNPYYDPEYYVIVRKMPSRDKGEYGQEIPNSTEIGFRIRDYYMEDATNNTIYCTVMKHDKSIEANTTLSFGIQGLQGSDYTFKLSLENKRPFVIFQGEPVQLISKIYDAQGKLVTDLREPEYSWYHEGNGGLSLSSDGIITPSKEETNINNCAHYIVQATIREVEVNIGGKNRNLDLTQFLPIVVVRKDFVYDGYLLNILRYDGKAFITYDNTGANPQYYKDSFQLYGISTANQIIKMTNGTWGNLHTNACVGTNGQFNQNFYPYIDSNNHSLIVPSLYLANPKDEIISITYTVNGQIVFIMPLFVSHRVFDSYLLNSWDGSLTLDKENGTILSAMMGAGIKNSDNTFSGVLMGDCTVADANTDIGLYGYHSGQQSFGFKVDGTAFIGKAGKGRIYFDGTNGVIKSANFNGSVTDSGTVTGNNYGTLGSYFNLTNGLLIATNAHFRGSITTGGSITGSTITVGGGQGQGYFHVDSNGNMTATGNAVFNGSITSGSTISGATVSGGNIIGSNIFGGCLGIGRKEGSPIANDSLSNYNCYVDSNGYLYANNADINGKMTTTQITENVGTVVGHWYDPDNHMASVWPTVYGTKIATAELSAGGLTFSINIPNAVYRGITSAYYAGYNNTYYGPLSGSFAIVPTIANPEIVGAEFNFPGTPMAFLQMQGNIDITGMLNVHGFANFQGSLAITGALETWGHVYFYGLAQADGSSWAPTSSDVYITEGGHLKHLKASSSKRFKHNIKPINNDFIQQLYDIPVYTFIYNDNWLSKDDERYGKVMPGFISEDWDAIIPIAVNHEEKTGLPTMWNHNIIVPLMFQMIKNDHEVINSLQQEIKELKEKIK